MSGKLDAAAIRAALTGLTGWELGDGALVANFRFDDFNEAFGFMTRVALVAEQMQHHPDWSNVYNEVRVRLATHDEGGVTEKDLALARLMNLYAGR